MSDALEQAKHAASTGDWQQAFELLTEADSAGLLSPMELPFLGEVAYAAGHFEETVDAWERAHAAAAQGGDRLAAAGAAVRVAMHLLFDTALMAPVRGWLHRADQLLEGLDDSPAHAWLAVIRAYERMLTGDTEEARRWAERAVDLGARCDPAALAVARMAHARLVILDGDVTRGLAMLDEAAAATVSGDLDPISLGVVYCELVCALQGLAQYDAAEEWTEAMERWSRKNAVGSIHGRCRVHRAEILRLRGAHDDAEREALAACEELRPYLRREMGWPLSELGRIRLRTGDIAGAEEALVAAHRAGWDPQPGLALVRLSQGDAAGATSGIRDALERPLRVPSKELPPNNELQRAPLLEAQVQIEIASGDVDRARAAADELTRIADRFQSKALVAAAASARGRVALAQGMLADAEGHLSEAVRLWSEVGAPYEAATARLDLSEALRAAGSADRADLELRAARDVLDDVASGIRREEPARAERSTFRREGDYWSIEFDGRTVRVRDIKGMRHLARLLGSAGREFHVLDLVAMEAGEPERQDRQRAPELSVSLGDAGEILDEKAKDAYRKRLAEIDDDLEEARSLGDTERVAQAETERGFLARELAGAVGLGGRDRKAASASERARAGVTRAIRQAMARIGEHHRALGDHLEHAIRTGTYCGYFPDPRSPVTWELG